MRVRVVRVTPVRAAPHTTGLADQPIRVREVHVMRVPAVLGMQAPVVPLTMVQAVLFTRGQEVPRTMVLAGLPIQIRAVRVTQVPEARVTRVRGVPGARVLPYANKRRETAYAT